MDETPTGFHTMAATNAFERYRDRTSSWTEYQDTTIVLMIRIVYDSLTLSLNPFVVAMTDTFRGITDCIEAINYGKGFEQGSLKVEAMYVQWKDDAFSAFAGIRPGDANLSLDKHNVSAVLRLIKQRSGSDTVLVIMADTSGHGADSQAIAGVELGIGFTALEKPAMSPQKAIRAGSSKHTNAKSPVMSPQKAIRAGSSKHTTAKSPRKPTQATTDLEDFEEGEVVESTTNLPGPPPKPRQPARKSSPSPRFPQSFHDAQREAAEKRKHRHSSGSDDNARHRQKMDDSPGAGRRDRRRDDPYGFG